MKKIEKNQKSELINPLNFINQKLKISLKYSKDDIIKLYKYISEKYSEINKKCIQKGEGYLKYPYLIPAGYYKEMWDWDGFFMGYYFATHKKEKYLKYWALNLLEGVDKNGYVSGCATIEGPRVVFGKFSMKPFLNQGIVFYSRYSNDYSWIEPYYEKLVKVLEYRDSTQLDKKYNLYFWEMGFQSGADNNVALNIFKDDTRSFLACDCSVMQLREFYAMSEICDKLNKSSDSIFYKEKAEKLKNSIRNILYCKNDNMFYNIDRETGEFYKRISYSCFWPLIEKIIDEKEGKLMIEKYLLNSNYMKSDFGFRTLSINDPDYNNKNIINPFSNWQGPIWVISSYIYSIGLYNYNFKNEIEWLVWKLGNILRIDLIKYNTMHESYHADNGQGLAPDQSYKDDDGNFIGFIGWNLLLENLLEGVIYDKWNLILL